MHRIPGARSHRLGGLLAGAVLVCLGALAACAVSPGAGLWGLGLFLASALLLHWSARAAPGTSSDTSSSTMTSTGTDSASDTTTTTSTGTETGTGTSTDSSTGTTTTECPDCWTDWTGPCLSLDVHDGCCPDSIDDNRGNLVFLAPALLGLAPRRRRRELIERLAAEKALPEDVIDRLQQDTQHDAGET